MKQKRNQFLMIQVFVIIITILILANCAPYLKEKNQSDTAEHPCYIQMLEAEMARNPEAWMLDFEQRPKWNYTHGLLLMAAKKVWEKTGKQKYFDYMKAYYDLMLDDEGNIGFNYNIDNYNIDHIKPGINLFDLYEYSGDERYLTAMHTLRDQLKTHPRTLDSAFWHKNIYPHQLWLDGVYMNAPFYARYGIVYNEPKNFDDVIHQITLIELKTRDETTGLLYHAYDESRSQEWANPANGQSPNFWGRAMGWYAMALVDVLDYIPVGYPGRESVVGVLQRLADAISQYQDPDTGLWYQVLNQGEREGNYLEASVSCMFAYTIMKAVNNRLIDTSYTDMAVKACEGIFKHLVSYDEEGYIHLNQVCAVAGLGGNPYRDGSYEYYIKETIRSNDPKGVGPFILLCLELEKAGLTDFITSD